VLYLRLPSPTVQLPDVVSMTHTPETTLEDVFNGAFHSTIPVLVSVAAGCFQATAMPAKLQTDPSVRAELERFSAITRVKVPWQLTADVVGLATGRLVTPYTIRRLGKKGSLKVPGFSSWKKSRALVDRLIRHRDAGLTHAWFAVAWAASRGRTIR
jgi:hypothetical protein